jgi:hypothetical protein
MNNRQRKRKRARALERKKRLNSIEWVNHWTATGMQPVWFQRVALAKGHAVYSIFITDEAHWMRGSFGPSSQWPMNWEFA